MRAGGPTAYCGNMGQGIQLLIGACVGGPATYSEYIGAESTVSTQGQGSSCLQWVHGARGPVAYNGYMGARRPVAYSGYMGAGGSSYLQWVHGGKGI